MKLINNPLFKIVGIIAVLYFALFHNNQNKNSLRNRLATEKIEQNLNYIKNQTLTIKNGINKAKEYEESQTINQNSINQNGDNFNQQNQDLQSTKSN